MSETLKWARDILDHSWDDDHDPIPRLARAIIMDADRLNVADTSPASQERDDLERLAEMADVSPAHCGDPEVLKVLHDIRDKLRALARLRSGSEPGDYRGKCVCCLKPVYESADDVCELNDGRWVCSRDCWERAARMYDEPAARPSGGDGAHDWEMVGEGDRYNSSHRCRKCGEYADKEVGNGPCRGEGAPEPDGWITPLDSARIRAKRDGPVPSVNVWAVGDPGDLPVYFDRLPPEREACSTCTEGAPPYFCRECVHRREEGLRGALEREAEAREPDGWVLEEDHQRWLNGELPFVGFVLRREPDPDRQCISVFFGTPSPDREAEDGLEAAVSLMADREAEIRADERRKSQTKVEAREPDAMLLYNKHGISEVEWREGRDPKSRGMEREWHPIWFGSPNRSDEP